MMESIRRSRKGDPRVGRRRRRRSYQPKYKRIRRRRLGMGIILGFVLLFIVAIVTVGLTIKVRLESDQFREELSGVFRERFGGRVEMGDVSVRGTTVAVPWVRLEGALGGQLERLEFREVALSLALPSFFGTTWVVKSLTTDECDVVINPGAGGERRGSSEAEGEVFEPRLGLGAVPLRWQLVEFEVDFLSFRWKGERGSEGGEARAVRLVGTNVSQQRSVRVVEGTVTGLGNVDYELWDGKITVGKEGLALKDGKMRPDRERGSVVVSGVLALGEDEVSRLQLRFVDIELRDVLTDAWADRISGRLNGDVTISKEMGANRTADIEGVVNLSGGEIRNFEMLDRLSDFCGESRIMRVEVGEEASARVKRSGGFWTIDDLTLTQPGLLRITGMVELSPGGGVEGALRVGVPEAYLVRSAAGRPSFFGRPEGGFSMADVSVSGEEGELVEDLSLRLARHVGGAMAPSISDQGEGRSRFLPGSRASGRELIDEQAKMEELFNALLE
ncbi:MAG: hypothetical protein AAGD22_06075 [Verrucomicrobiota bacterium]